jgi:hypothetical protein
MSGSVRGDDACFSVKNSLHLFLEWFVVSTTLVYPSSNAGKGGFQLGPTCHLGFKFSDVLARARDGVVDGEEGGHERKRAASRAIQRKARAFDKEAPTETNKARAVEDGAELAIREGRIKP